MKSLLIVCGCLLATVAAWGTTPQEFEILLKQARKKGADPAAQFRVAQCLEKGDGVPQDAVRARVWYSNAASNGSQDAVKVVVGWNKQMKGVPAELPKRKVLRGAALKAKSRELACLLAEHDRVLSQSRSEGKKDPKLKWSKVVALLKEGADPNMEFPVSEVDANKSGGKVSAVKYALDWGDYKLGDLLLLYGGSFLLDWRNSMSGVLYTLGRLERDLIPGKKIDPDLKRRFQNDFKREEKKLAYLMARGYDPRMFETTGHTQLERAAIHNASRGIEMLVEAGADVNQTNSPRDNSTGSPAWDDVDERTAFYAAISNAAPQAVATLIRLGGNVNFIDKGGSTPLDWALQKIQERRKARKTGNKDVDSALAEALERTEQCAELLKQAGGKTAAELKK